MSTNTRSEESSQEHVTPGSTIRGRQLSLHVAKIAVFAAIYVVTSFFPLSVFIGFGSSFLTFALVMTPVMAVLLRPQEALPAAFIGGFIATWVAPQSATFQLFSLLLPVAGTTMGSLLYHYPRVGGPAVAALLVGAMAGYLFARPQFPFWVLPHGLALILSIILFAISVLPLSLSAHVPMGVRVPIVCFVATMCEQAAMVTLAVYYLLLPWQVFATAFPLMLLERSVATIGSLIVVTAILRAIPNYFPSPKA